MTTDAAAGSRLVAHCMSIELTGSTGVHSGDQATASTRTGEWSRFAMYRSLNTR